MADQPNTDRAEELRGLSFEELLDRTAQHRGWMNVVQNEPRLGVPSDFEEAAQIQAEWDRRCAEREALRNPEAHDLLDELCELVSGHDGDSKEREQILGLRLEIQSRCAEREAQAEALTYLESVVREHLDPESECPPDSVRDAASKIQRLETAKESLRELEDCRFRELREAQAELERLREWALRHFESLQGAMLNYAPGTVGHEWYKRELEGLMAELKPQPQEASQ